MKRTKSYREIQEQRDRILSGQTSLGRTWMQRERRRNIVENVTDKYLYNIRKAKAKNDAFPVYSTTVTGAEQDVQYPKRVYMGLNGK